MLKNVDWNMSKHIQQPSMNLYDDRESGTDTVNTLE